MPQGSDPVEAGVKTLDYDSTPGRVIDAAAGRGAVLLTPNQRTARRLSRSFDERRRGEGNVTWRPLQVLPWTVWTASVFRAATVSGQEDRVLLNGLQEQAIWRAVLQESGESGLRNDTSLARLCASALRLLGAYDTAASFSPRSATNASQEAEAFTRWYRRFVEICEAERFLPGSHLDLDLARRLRKGSADLPGEVLLFGFEDMTPSQLAVVQAMRDAGANVAQHSLLHASAAPAKLLRCRDDDEEYAACAAWALDLLRADPGATAAIVVPDLDSCREELERTLRNTLVPVAADVHTQLHAPFEFSIGRPLARLPILADAILLARWCAGPVSFEDAGTVLRSRWLTLAGSPERGAELDAFYLRRSRHLRQSAAMRDEITLPEAALALEKEAKSVAESLRHLHAAARKLSGSSTSHAGVADGLRDLLRQAGWPGETALDSNAFQAISRWDSVLDNVASLDMLAPSVDFAAGVAAIVEAARDTAFAPENQFAALQVVTVAEAAGTVADSLWFLHAGESTWPPQRQAHPLLPRDLQARLNVPGADAGGDEASAAAATERTLHRAAAVTFSYAEGGAEATQSPAPVVAALPGIDREDAAPTPAGHDAALVSVEDAQPITAHAPHVAGGIGVLRAQAQCGFRAFAELRLSAREMETLDAGLSAGDRGSHVHGVLERVWKAIGSHDELIRLAKDIDADGRSARDRLLSAGIEDVLAAAPAHTWDAAYLQVQRVRLHRLLSDWLDAEATRPPFQVLHTELPMQDAAVGPLLLNIRVDRIDSVSTPDGDVAVLIDYKTGHVERADWFGDRPDEPQLPLYAVAGAVPQVQGVAFASVRVGAKGMKFEDMGADPALLNYKGRSRKYDLPFDEQMEQWRTDLAALATAFADGRAAVDPKDYLVTCKNCESRLLCRVDVARLEPEDLEEEDEEAGLAW